MASTWATFATITILFTAASCHPHTIDLPDECIGKDFCDVKPKIYDVYEGKMKEAMQQIYKEFPAIKGDLFDTKPRNDYVADNCKPESKLITPFIVNGSLVIQTDFFTQKFWETSCKLRKPGPQYKHELGVEGGKCFDSMPDIIGTCRTKKTTIKLFIYNLNTHMIEHVPAPLSVCCSCDITTRELPTIDYYE